VTDPDCQPETGRPCPVATVLDVPRKRIDQEAFEAAIFSLEAVTADLGHGDVRPVAGVDRGGSTGCVGPAHPGRQRVGSRELVIPSG
jgi:hypothetical protein